MDDGIVTELVTNFSEFTISHTLTDLDSGKIYTFKTRSSNSVGQSIFST